MLIIAKLYVSWQKGLPVKVAYFIGVFNLEWHIRNEVGNMAILVLRRDREKL